ncbi:MAG: ABC transporter ATP-binding protein [Halanaerobiaceae bacterium]|jgi:ABC-2 type transport system ATP-binding protein|nr:ABC transporter ATP-binding protein [Halanaerobiaceae bacterium]
MGTSQDNNIAIEVKKLTKRYGELTAVDEISFDVKRGEIFGFLGPNGAGKTSTINMLTGLCSISSGELKINGQSSVKKIQEMIGVVPSESNLYPELSGFENLCFCASLYGMRRREREREAGRLLEMFNLSEAADRPFRAYSKGMKRKLAIAAAIIHRPDILFLDEPTTGIDVASARQIRRLISEMNKAGTTIFLTTHYLEEAERLCERVAFIVRGKIKQLAETEQLLKGARKDNVLEFLLDRDITLEKGPLLEGLSDYRPVFDKDKVRIHTPCEMDIKYFVDIFDEWRYRVYEAKLIRPALEDVFVEITGIGPGEAEAGKNKGGREN